MCKLLESRSPLCLSLVWGVIPQIKSPRVGGVSTHPCQPTCCRLCPGRAAPLQPLLILVKCLWALLLAGVLGDACSAPAICALSYPLNHGDLHGNSMRPGISVPLCIKQHQLPCNLIVCVLNINQQTVGWSRAAPRQAPTACLSGEMWPILVSPLSRDALQRKFRLRVSHLEEPPLWGSPFRLHRSGWSQESRERFSHTPLEQALLTGLLPPKAPRNVIPRGLPSQSIWSEIGQRAQNSLGTVTNSCDSTSLIS